MQGGACAISRVGVGDAALVESPPYGVDLPDDIIFAFSVTGEARAYARGLGLSQDLVDHGMVFVDVARKDASSLMPGVGHELIWGQSLHRKPGRAVVDLVGLPDLSEDDRLPFITPDLDGDVEGGGLLDLGECFEVEQGRRSRGRGAGVVPHCEGHAGGTHEAIGRHLDDEFVV